MIKIVEEHHKNIKRVTCPNCGSILEYDKEDVLLGRDIETSESYHTLTCPICEETILL